MKIPGFGTVLELGTVKIDDDFYVVAIPQESLINKFIAFLQRDTESQYWYTNTFSSNGGGEDVSFPISSNKKFGKKKYSVDMDISLFLMLIPIDKHGKLLTKSIKLLEDGQKVFGGSLFVDGREVLLKDFPKKFSYFTIKDGLGERLSWCKFKNVYFGTFLIDMPYSLPTILDKFVSCEVC